MKKFILLSFLIFLLILIILIIHPCFFKPSEKPPQIPTPLPPDETIKKFVACYNTRNYTCLYNLFSKNVTSSHALNETKIKGEIVKWEITKRDVEEYQRILTINITLVCDGKLKRKTIKVPMRLEGEEFKIDSWILGVLKCG